MYGNKNCNNSECSRTCAASNGRYPDVCLECFKSSNKYQQWMQANKKGNYKSSILDDVSLDTSSEDEMTDRYTCINNNYNKLFIQISDMKKEIHSLKKIIKNLTR